MIPEGWAWNQADLGPNHELNAVLVSLIALGPNGVHNPVGTGFVVSAGGDVAVVCTATHVLDAATSKQRGPRRHHPTAPPEFRAPEPLLSLEPGALRALHVVGHSVEMATVTWALLDAHTDLAFLALTPQLSDGTHRFDREVRFSNTSVCVGDEVALLGYAGMEVRNELEHGDGDSSLQIARELVLRLGRISHLHADGHILVRGECFESTIPVSDGMSGSPVLRHHGPGTTLEVVGVLSSEPEREYPEHLDRRTPGQSVIARLSPQLSAESTQHIRARLTFEEGVLIERPPAT